MATAILGSNNGTANLRLTGAASTEDVDGTWLQVDLMVTGTTWAENETPDVNFQLAGVRVLEVTLKKFADAIGDWVSGSMHDQAATPLTVTMNLGRAYGEKLVLEFGERDGITSEGKPVFALFVGSSSISFEHHFVTDQSCVRIFHEGLRQLVNAA